MRLSQIGDDFLKWFLSPVRPPLVPYNANDITENYPLLNRAIDALAVVQAQTFAQQNPGAVYIHISSLNIFLAISMKHLLVLLDSEDDWRAREILKE